MGKPIVVNEVNEAKLETFGSLIDPNEGGLHTIVGQVKNVRTRMGNSH